MGLQYCLILQDVAEFDAPNIVLQPSDANPIKIKVSAITLQLKKLQNYNLFLKNISNSSYLLNYPT